MVGVYGWWGPRSDGSLEGGGDLGVMGSRVVGVKGSRGSGV